MGRLASFLNGAGGGEACLCLEVQEEVSLASFGGAGGHAAGLFWGGAEGGSPGLRLEEQKKVWPAFGIFLEEQKKVMKEALLDKEEEE